MADPFSTLPPEYTLEAQKLARRQKMAEMLMQQGMAPIEQPRSTGRFAVPISPLQGVAKIAQAYAGGQMQNAADKDAAGLGDKYRQGIADELLKYQTTKTGTPEQSFSEGIDERIVPAVPGDPRAAITQLMVSPFPQAQRVAQTELTDLNQREQRKDERDWRTQEATEARAARAQEAQLAREGRLQERILTLDAASQNATLAREDREARAREAAELRRELQASQQAFLAAQRKESAADRASIGAALMRAVPTSIQDPADPNKTIVVDANNPTKVIGVGPKLTQTGTAEQKLSLAAPQAKLRVESMTQNMDRLEAAMTELSGDEGLTRITGTVMGRTPNITNTATGAQAKLDSIKSQVFQSSLQAMREASKTGGAVGNVSDREGDKLERTLAALDQAQGTDAFKAELAKAVRQVRLSKQLIQTAYEEQFGGIPSASPLSQPAAATPTQPPVAPTTPQKVRKYNPATGRIE